MERHVSLSQHELNVCGERTAYKAVFEYVARQVVLKNRMCPTTACCNT